jgi:hypothetical protein
MSWVVDVGSTPEPGNLPAMEMVLHEKVPTLLGWAISLTVGRECVNEGDFFLDFHFSLRRSHDTDDERRFFPVVAYAAGE